MNRILPTLLCGLVLAASAFAQAPAAPPPASEARPPRDAAPGDPDFLRDGGPQFGPGDRPGPRGPGGPGGFGAMQQETKLVDQFDADGNKRLNAEERKKAREFLAKELAEGRGTRGPGGRPGGPPGGPGGPGGPGPRGNEEPPQPGPKIAPADVKSYRAMPLYDVQTLRTLFLEFENADWEKELADFNNTDVEVPAKLTVDGRAYENVGVHFRGMSSFFMVGEGRKHSLNLSLDFVDGDQRLGGYRTLNLLNSAGDPTMLRAVLYYQIAREYLPAPKANWARVVINGESWGVYVNTQQFNKEFIHEWFGTKKGERWKAPGSPGGRAGLEYLGEDAAEYKKRFQIKSKDDPASWAALIELCRVLNQTPADQLEEKLSPILDLEGALRFLALENVFINTDGYWTRASDFHLYRDASGRFHIIPHDVNETFMAPEGPGMRRQENESNAPVLDPFAGSDDPKKPLLNKLLAAPALRSRYRSCVREIAETWLDWNKLGPLAQQYEALLADYVKSDTRKLASFENFEKGVAEDIEEQGFRGPRRKLSLKSFVEQRRAFLLNHPEIKTAEPLAALRANPSK